MTRTVKFLLMVSLIFCGGIVDRIVAQMILLMNERDKQREKVIEKKDVEEVAPVLVDIDNEFWNAPAESPKGGIWTFDLFTAPTITNKDGVYKASLPWLIQVDQQAKIVLVSLKRKVYPLQYLGFFLSPGKDKNSNEIHLMLKDVDKNERINAKIGDTVTSHKFEILRFEEIGSDGAVAGYPKVYVKDNEAQREEILTPQQKYYDYLFHIELQLGDDPEKIVLSHIGETFSAGGIEYKLLSVDIVQRKVVLDQKIGKDEMQIEITAEK